MAIDANNARLLMALRRDGISFKEVATIGRQGLFLPTPLVRNLFVEFNISPAVNDPAFFSPEEHQYADLFFKELGAESLTCIDYSDYEGATLLQDMNQPLRSELRNKFDLLIDSGSLEHMFNFPQAVKNYMDMVKPGGYLILLNMPVNNHMGHGFYQFSPELFFNLFRINGFKSCAMLIVPDMPFADFYSVTDPEKVNSRICLCNDMPTQLFVVVKKIQNQEQLEYPIQNDYVKSWSKESGSADAKVSPSGGGAKRHIQRLFKNINYRAYFQLSVARNWNVQKKQYSFNNAAFFTRVDLVSTKIYNP